MSAADDCIDEVARFLVTFGAVDRAAARHVPAAGGGCAGCGPSAGSWPCAVAASTARARVALPGSGALSANPVMPAGPA